MILTSIVTPDEYTDYVSNAFDYEFSGKSEFTLPEFTKPKEDFNIGVIYGSSGSGKSRLLYKEFMHTPLSDKVFWDNEYAIVSNFPFDMEPEDVVETLCAVGLASVPTWCKPYNVLSNGEAYRANVARRLVDPSMIEYTCFDEFTSEINRETAKSLSVSLSKYIRSSEKKNIVIATCHKDVLEWLEPDWVFDCDLSTMELNKIKPTLKKVATIELL